MALLTVDQLREHISTSLVDAALQRLLDDAEAQIDAYAGPLGVSVTEYVNGGWGQLVLTRPATSITSVVEIATDESELTLATDDYRIRSSYVLDRLRGGTNPRSAWRGLTKVVYTPEDDTEQRKIVQLELVKLDIAYNPGLSSETVGSWTQQYRASGTSLADARGDILSRLRQGRMLVID